MEALKANLMQAESHHVLLVLLALAVIGAVAVTIAIVAPRVGAKRVDTGEPSGD